MRLFVAIELPDDVKDVLAGLRMEGSARRTKREQFHLTLRFIGDGIEDAQFKNIKQALAAVSAAPFDLQLRGVGQFPTGKKPARVLWVGVVNNPLLNTLQQEVEAALEHAGIARETRAFLAHMTLARLDPPQNAAHFLEANQAFESRVLRVEEFVLFSSVLARGGAAHYKEAFYRLTK
jgi:2'-5' RNA ligase